jgi:hypothetical protein
MQFSEKFHNITLNSSCLINFCCLINVEAQVEIIIQQGSLCNAHADQLQLIQDN